MDVDNATIVFAIHAVLGVGLFLFGAYRIAIWDDLGGLVNFAMGVGVFGLGLFMARNRT